ncbi:hypothetical protein [Variovorax sp. AFSI2.2]|uniref:hypothetical protein n=1 Tax=Variovorax sp. AFSI2.2 TaxID=3384160 RepID=UPI003EBEB391
MIFRRINPVGAPALLIDEPSPFVVGAGPDPRDADPAYQRWVLACLQVRLSIQADQTFPHPPDRRAQVARIIRASLVAE